LLLIRMIGGGALVTAGIVFTGVPGGTGFGGAVMGGTVLGRIGCWTGFAGGGCGCGGRPGVEGRMIGDVEGFMVPLDPGPLPVVCARAALAPRAAINNAKTRGCFVFIGLKKASPMP